MDNFMAPRSVAVIGATRKTGDGSYNVIENMRAFGYDGEIYPVNPFAEEISSLNKDVIKKILKHLNLWDTKRKPPPKAHAPPFNDTSSIDDAFQPRLEEYVNDPDYPVESYF